MNASDEQELSELSNALEEAFDRDDAEAVKRIERRMDELTGARALRLVEGADLT